MRARIDYILILFVLLAALALFLPVGEAAGTALQWWNTPAPLALALLSMATALYQITSRSETTYAALLLTFGCIAGAYAPLLLVRIEETGGYSAVGLWLYLAVLGLVVWRAMALLSRAANHNHILALAVPALFGIWLLYLWQLVTVGFGVPSVLLPSPEQIGAAIANNASTLYADFYQTVVKSVFSGFLFGCSAGFLVAVLVDRIPFMQRGLLPLGSLVSAIPIVGIAPIMVMWFGFDWQSKAAVIVVMTFFPMLINTLAGLQATGRIETDLMRSYAAGYWQTLFFVRLPNALPFIFNALKINSTLAMIGAIVAEFFGTPIVGMGFRISTEVGRMNVDIVWATIAVAAVVGSLFYGILALMERRLTFWHSSYRQAK
ncbi:MAG: ABC transporter permease [Sneathiella sp.]